MSGIGTYSDTKATNIAWAKNIPSHWHEYRIKHVFKIVKRIVGELGYEVLSITQKGIKVKDTTSGEGQLAMDYSKYQLAEVGDFAMNHMDLLTGFVDISKFHGVISPDYRVFKLADEKSDSSYMLYLMQLCYLQKIFFGHGKGVSMFGRWRLPAENFKNFRIPVPPKKEQIQIANYLNVKTSKIDRLISLKEKLLNLLYERILTTIQKSETPINNSNAIFWTSIDKDWRIEKTKRIFKEINIKNHPNEELLAVTQGRGVIPKRLCEENFVSPSTGIENQKLVEKEDFVISLRSFQGGIEYSNYKGIVSPAYTVIRLKNKYNTPKYRLFYKYLFKSQEFISQLNTVISGIRDGKNISWSDFSELNIPLPQEQSLSTLEEAVNSYEKQKALFLKEKEVLIEYRTALISEAVTGKIDVRNYKIPEYKPANELETEISIAAESEPEYNGLN